MKRMLRSAPSSSLHVKHSTQFALVFIGGILLASMLLTFAQIYQNQESQSSAPLSQVEVTQP